MSRPTNEIHTPLQVNLLRLFRWHALDNATAARLLGSTPNTVGDWLSGKREPGANYILLIGRLFSVDPRGLYDAPTSFGAVVADPTRLDGMDELEWRRRGFIPDEYGIAWRQPNE